MVVFTGVRPFVIFSMAEIGVLCLAGSAQRILPHTIESISHCIRINWTRTEWAIKPYRFGDVTMEKIIDILCGYVYG